MVMNKIKLRKCKHLCSNCNGYKCFSLISFRLLYKSPYFYGFAYDYISDEEIEESFQYIQFVNIEIEWQDDYELSNNKNIPDKLKHAIRVAKLVDIIRNNKGIDAVSFDTYSKGLSFISDGHHRIRALQYLQYEYFPASIAGTISLIQKITRKYYKNYKLHE